nr:hypothetical protein HK105_002333 [Polyrhizophydium stewartii]
MPQTDRIITGVSASGSLSSRYPNAREISETFTTKLFEMRWCAIALVTNVFFMYYVLQMPKGIMIPLPDGVVTSIGCVVAELILLISNVITFRALDDGASAWFGAQLTSKRGFSLAVCGFFQAAPFQKWPFATQLSLNSTCRSLFTRISVIWILLEGMKILTPISATSITGSSTRIDSGTVECVVFSETGSPVDRQWPTVVAEAGFAELVFGSSLGSLRSEQTVDNTTFVMSPQIIGAVNDGDTIVGPGFITTISTKCRCVQNNNITSLRTQGVSNDTAAAILGLSSQLGPNLGLTSYIEVNSTLISVKTLISGSTICGGHNFSFLPMCTTSFSDHKSALVLMRYMTDGTTASIAPESVDVRAVLDDANLDIWVGAALKSILGGELSSFSLPSTIPGVLNPLMWWTSPNLMTIDPALVEGGIETLFSILLRAGTQRTYATHGEVCGRNVAIEGQSIVRMAPYGVDVAFFTLSFQLFITILSALAFVPWLRSVVPIGPGVRALREPVYFTTLINSSSVCHGFDQLCNAQIHAIWQNLDLVVRIGEPIGTRTEGVGHISMDRPKLIGAMTNGKRYF